MHRLFIYIHVLYINPSALVHHASSKLFFMYTPLFEYMFYSQCHVPVFKRNEIRGHAARVELCSPNGKTVSVTNKKKRGAQSEKTRLRPLGDIAHLRNCANK